ncbi:hypothetical protein LVB87_11440 [Lysobacter sp. KIS68-7]|uniref:hypothetical protein n=1 Tax=Lysobacter sp. KIS68-7 TaxID=2904252 RepID=UPI001E2C49B0|nr:hypothetical protein [Lysobacter sp. KIS68-7]UHQ18795.1 hypothetical protein LVB87_11440 [Lysobacter sp. KIS68-7]
MQRISLLLAAIVVASVFYVVQATPPAPKYKIVSTVEKKSPPAHPAGSVSGTFKLIEAPDGFAPIKIENGQPYVSGGACLVYQDMHHVKTCHTQADCTSMPPAGPENGFGYCHEESGTCWFKKASTPMAGPGGFLLDDYCLKSTPAKTLVVDNLNQLPIPKGPPNTTRWRITACQGLTMKSCRDGVEGVDFHTWWGDVIEP